MNDDQNYSRRDADASFVDPICGMRISADTASTVIEYEGRSYYFCSSSCEHDFEKDAARHASAPEVRFGKGHSSRSDRLLPASILISTFMIVGAWVYVNQRDGRAAISPNRNPASLSQPAAATPGAVPDAGAELPATWGDLGKRMVAAGVIDRTRFMSLYEDRGGLGAAELALLDGADNGKLKVTSANAGILLNMFWALGIGNKNAILDSGPMKDSRYGGDPGRFASTGGWTLGKGSVMDHYSAHAFVTLSAEQQALVERMARSIYRPCCDNSTYLPDCNHGMAMLGLLELMASQGASETAMYRAALVMNAYWFPQQYETIARYLESKGLAAASVAPKEILGKEYSSGSGFRQVAALVPVQENKKSAGGCGV